jgi:hypothetical protein
MKTTGVYVESHEAREIFRIGGANINEENNMEMASRIIDYLEHIETYKPPQLSDEILKKVRAIIEGAEAELGIKE